MNAIYWFLGVLFLALAKAKHAIHGYTTPKPFSDIQRCITYDASIAETWVEELRGFGESVRGKRVLELGPGSDLGTGLCLLSHGAASYTAFDRHDLAADVPSEIYTGLNTLMGSNFSPSDLNYVARGDFNMEVLPQAFDLVVSNAAFEHFDDIERTARQLSKVVTPGAVLCAFIDLQTHSRWIREADPNNIYRYPRWLYRLFYFPGQPNRVRPHEYRQAFERCGWTVHIHAMQTFHLNGRTVHKEFRADPLLNATSIALLARIAG
ncbi:class I SAM-dependent methyltransferase [Nitrosospira briensis]|uniref:Methyltransferase domain-containing protein n=1 Tax=Nitrosospira briensis TaxID=35799 RepID=A0A1I5AU01_9PROT|nr:methyltransferase domain-containing protein [Nitrosospira briensis]SFN65917.1 Methyltransferase domain-containing protein [Nitrosospira briensis]SFN86410.1 Methyltransferase domain-containing protein [Nitrosospira briensis]